MKTGKMEKARLVMQRRGGKKDNLAIFPGRKVGGQGGKGQEVPAAPARRRPAPDVSLGERIMKTAYDTPVSPSRMKRIERLREQIHEGTYCVPSLLLAERLIEQNAC